MAAEAVSPPPPLSQNIEPLFAYLADAQHIALAVSGGSDSMALLRLIAKRQERRRVTVSVLTVDHGLRAASAKEAAQVAQWCKELGLAHQTLCWAGRKPETGIQAKARTARYDLLTRWCVDHGASHLLTGHTQDDQAETVLMRAQRSSAPASLVSIRYWQTWHNGVLIFRPLLGHSRTSLRDYCQSLGQPWLDDPSNEDVRFERVRTRHYLLQHPDLIPALSEVAVKAAIIDRDAKDLARDWLRQFLIIFPEGYGQVPRQALIELDGLYQAYILRDLLAMFGGGQPPEAGEIDRLSRWLKQGEYKRRTLGGAVLAARKDYLTVGREWGRINPDPQAIPANGSLIWDGRFRISAATDLFIISRGSLKECCTSPGKGQNVPDFVWKSLPVVVKGRISEKPPAHGFEIAEIEFIRCLRPI